MAEEEVVAKTTPAPSEEETKSSPVAADLKRKLDELRPEEAEPEAEGKISPSSDLAKEEPDLSNSDAKKPRLGKESENGHEVQKSDTQVEGENDGMKNTGDVATEVAQNEKSESINTENSQINCAMNIETEDVKHVIASTEIQSADVPQDNMQISSDKSVALYHLEGDAPHPVAETQYVSSKMEVLNTKVDWDEIEIEPIGETFEISKGDAIVAHETVDVEYDWTSYFKTDIVFDSPESVKKWLLEKGREHNMAIVVGRSDFTSSRASRIIYQCERSGVYKKSPRSREDTVSKTGTKSGKRSGTKKCDCPFKIKVTNQSVGGNHWVIEVVCGKHNHPLPSHIQGHACYARLTPEEKEFFINLSKSGVKPKAALSIMKERNPKCSTSLQTLYNVKKKLKTFSERPLPLDCERPLPLDCERPLPLDCERPLPLDSEQPLPLEN